jgi:uncharacterized membrane protein YphA (DoxX/SURF4 family)
MNPYFIFVVRVVLAVIWLYNGLWLKVIVVEPHHLIIMKGVVAGTDMSPVLLLKLIGSLETLLAVGILSGALNRFVNFFQIAILLLMNAIGIICGKGAIPHPVGLILSNLPMVMCALMVAFWGPGAWALQLGNGMGRGKNKEWI